MADAHHSDDELNEEVDVTDGGQAPKLQHVKTTTGEEVYDVVVKVKGKIWRFDEGENVWKERGQGDAKILVHKQDAKKFIFVFRRDAVHTLAAHHAIGAPMQLKPTQNSDKMFMWATTKDYTDDPEGFPELFNIKFASKEIADEFKLGFDKACGRA